LCYTVVDAIRGGCYELRTIYYLVLVWKAALGFNVAILLRRSPRCCIYCKM